MYLEPAMEGITLLALVALTISVMTISLSYISWSGSKRSFRYPFIALMISEMLITWGYYLSVSSSTIDDKLLWNSIEFVGYVSAPVFMIIFALLFTGRKAIPPSRLLILSLPAILIEVALLTNDYHKQFYTSIVASDEIFRSYDASYGIFFYLFCAYILIMAIISVLIMVRHYFDLTGPSKTSVALVTFSATVSLVTIVANFALGTDLPGGIIVMAGLIVGSVPLFIGAFSFELFEMVPFANDRVMNTMQDCVIVLDENDRVLFVNRAAGNLPGCGERTSLCDDVMKVLPMLTEDMMDLTDGACERKLPVVNIGKEHFEMNVSAITDHTGKQMGKLVVMRDVTERWNAEEDARTTHLKLDLLNTITRHDIRNQLIILEARLGLISLRTDDPDIVRHIESGLRSVQNIDRQISFAKDYQELGINALAWQSLDKTFMAMGQLLDVKRIELTANTGGYEVLADPLLSKVFYNLIDNSLTHGKDVSRISLKAMENGDHLDVIYEDDGVGIRDDDKRNIFEKGVGAHSGLGLFLCMEILRTGRMDIVEDGTNGTGARFRITVPKGNYRIPERSNN
ncbi:MAG: histidine kinase N-terminal 7TM domain-containing protein [Methanomassiliicoccales archaeon]|jgi:two-component sensor histidine kinase